MRSILVGLFSIAACTAEDSSSRALHRFAPTAADEARLEHGLLPVLVLKDGAPSPGALFRIESWPIETRTLFATGQREPVLAEEDPTVIRADERGIVWYEPPPDYFWQRRASAGAHVWSHPFLCWQADEVRAAARAGILLSVAELYGLTEWRVEITPAGGFTAEQVPVFLVDERGVFIDAPRISPTIFRSLDHWVFHTKDEDKAPFAMVAGFDLARAIPLDRARVGAHFDLSDCGSLEVTLVNEHGAPWREPRAVFLEPADSERAVLWNRRRTIAQDSPSALASEGVAILAGVPAGRRWRVGAFLLPGSAMVSVECDGPSSAGEMRRIVLSAREESVEIRARLQDDGGLPASGAVGELRGDGLVVVPFRADADGFLTVRAPRAWLDANETVGIVEEFDPSRIDHAASISAAALREEGIVHVWTWSEQSAELLAQGRVVDDLGAGVPFANVYVWDVGANTRADARGYFRVESEDEPADATSLSVDSFWHVETEQELVKGSRGLEVRVQRGARIAGTIAESHLGSEPTVSYLREGAEEAVILWTGCWWSGEGEFEIGPIPVDAVEVRLEFRKGGTIVLRELPLVAGEVHRLSEPLQPKR